MLFGSDERQIDPEVVGMTRRSNPDGESRTVDGARSCIQWSHPHAVAAVDDVLRRTRGFPVP
jgi:hypothetical protein